MKNYRIEWLEQKTIEVNHKEYKLTELTLAESHNGEVQNKQINCTYWGQDEDLYSGGDVIGKIEPSKKNPDKLVFFRDIKKEVRAEYKTSNNSFIIKKNKSKNKDNQPDYKIIIKDTQENWQDIGGCWVKEGKDEKFFSCLLSSENRITNFNPLIEN